MLKRNREFNTALRSKIGIEMFTSVPHLVLLLSVILLIQAVLISGYSSLNSAVLPFSLSVVFSLIYFVTYLSIRRVHKAKHFAFLTFILLLFFYLTELSLFLFLEIRSLWAVLLITQILCGYYLLNKSYFYSMLLVHISIYILYVLVHFSNNFEFQSVLAFVFSSLITFLIHGDRRKSLLNLDKIYRSQIEINSRFIQLEENIDQVFILSSSDFQEFYYISSAFERTVTISREQMLKDPDLWMKSIHPGDADRIFLEMEGAQRDKKYREFDFRFIRDDSSIWLNFQLFPIDTAKDNIVDRFVIIVDNITDQKNAELKLAEAKSLDAEFAARIQRNLLFSDPDLKIKEIDIAAESIPSLDVGGDFFDFYRFSDSIVDIIIADVMGKGMIASMLGAASKSAFLKSRLDLTVQENNIPSIEKIMTLTNSTLSPELIVLGKFITMQYGRLNLKSRFFSFIDSGHTSLLYYSTRHKSCWSLKGWNMPIGFIPDEKMIVNLIPFASEDLFFFYSDGVTETENEEGEQFGERRLNYIINNSVHLTSSQIMNKIRNLVFHYSGPEGFADDVTCIAMKIGELANDCSIVDGIFPGRRESLQIVRAFIMSFLTNGFTDLKDEDQNLIILAINEAVANVIEHNYEKHPLLEGREILIEAGFRERICFFRIYYDGDDFDWTTVKAPDLSEMKSGGYGLHLMREIMDSLCYSTNIDGVQCLTLVKAFD